MQIIRIILAIPLLAAGALMVVMAVYGFFSETEYDVLEYIAIFGISWIFLRLGLFVFPRDSANLDETR